MMAESIPVRGSFTQATLRLMRRYKDDWAVKTFMVQLARAICDRFGARTPLEESRAVWQWIRENVAYRLDPVGAEWVQDPFETLVVSKAGDCDDMATAAGALLQAIGHPCRMMAVRWEGRSDFSHAVCMDDLVGKVVDPVGRSFEPWPDHDVRPAAMMEA